VLHRRRDVPRRPLELGLLHVHPDTVRRVVNRAVTPFALVAAGVLDELRGLSRPSVRRPR